MRLETAAFYMIEYSLGGKLDVGVRLAGRRAPAECPGYIAFLLMVGIRSRRSGLLNTFHMMGNFLRFIQKIACVI